MQRRRAGEVNGKFNQAVSFKSIRTGSESPVYMACCRGNRTECSHKTKLFLANPRFQALIWVLATK